MSGFVGLVHTDGARVDPGLLERLTASLAFRAPDSSHVRIEGSAGLGHALLLTVEGSGRERQPLSLDGSAWVVAHARLDAVEDLRANLIGAGRPGVGQASDPELILHAYHAWGDACAGHLLGDFAFAIWDAASRRLFCARDHFGVRPFYYAHVGRTLLFSNTLECLRLHRDVSSRLDEDALADFLSFGLKLDFGATAFEQVKALRPGHWLTCEGGETRQRRYWALGAERARFRRPEEYAERFRDLLQAAVADRLRTTRAAVLMSGGLDSTSVAATAQRVMRRAADRGALEAYTVVYDRLIPDEERHWAGIAAAHLSLATNYLAADDCALYGAWDEPVLHTPEPQENPFWAVPVRTFQRIAADGHRVVLTGEAGDAVAAPAHALPDLLATGHAGALARDVWQYWRRHGRRPPFWIRCWWRRKWRRKMGGAAHQAAHGTDDGWGPPAWLHPMVAESVRRRAADSGVADPWWAHEELQSPMWPWCTLLQDAGWTRVPVECRYPFLDLRLVAFMLSVPSVPWAHGKELMRVAMRGRLPGEVLRRGKAPLAGDRIEACVRRDGPPPMPEPKSLVWQFVDRVAFESEWRRGAQLRDLTRVISLDKWLQQQERRSGRLDVASG